MTIDRDRFIADNLGLVHACAGRYVGRGVEYDDLYQAACLGLIKAAGGFDPLRGVRFSTYAVPVILGEIRLLFRRGGSIKVSRGLRELGMRANRERDAFLGIHGRLPRISELADILGVSQEEAAQAVCASARPVSLTRDDGGEESPVCEPFDDPLIEQIALHQAISELPPEDRAIITARYLHHLTQTRTAAMLGMTQVQISRREKKILASLREKLSE